MREVLLTISETNVFLRGKRKSVPLQARGTRKVPGSYGSQIT